MLAECDAGGEPKNIISRWLGSGEFDRLQTHWYRQLIKAICLISENEEYTIVVQSIEIIKGLQDQRCLFILTTDLTPYLFRLKTDDNKISRLLYVALTSFLDHLTIVVTREVEDAYGKNNIDNFFKDII